MYITGEIDFEVFNDVYNIFNSSFSLDYLVTIGLISGLSSIEKGKEQRLTKLLINLKLDKKDPIFVDGINMKLSKEAVEKIRNFLSLYMIMKKNGFERVVSNLENELESLEVNFKKDKLENELKRYFEYSESIINSIIKLTKWIRKNE